MRSVVRIFNVKLFQTYQVQRRPFFDGLDKMKQAMSNLGEMKDAMKKFEQSKEIAAEMAKNNDPKLQAFLRDISSNKELMECLQDPQMQELFKDISTKGPTGLLKYMGNPAMMEKLNKLVALSSKVSAPDFLTKK